MKTLGISNKWLVFTFINLLWLGYPSTTFAKVATPPTTLVKKDLKVGKGAEAVAGKTVTVNYTGWLWENGKAGKAFDSSVDPKFGHVQPFKFVLGTGQVIKGWDEGVTGMKIGGKRKLTIPSEMAYGARGAGQDIGPNATLIFEVELLEVN